MAKGDRRVGVRGSLEFKGFDEEEEEQEEEEEEEAAGHHRC